MVNKEEYKKYVKQLLEKEENMDVRVLSLWYKLGSILLLIFGIVFLLFTIPSLRFGVNRLFVIAILSIILSICMIMNIRKTKKYYRGDFREKIISYLLEEKKYRFDKNGRISSLDFECSQFAKKSYSCFRSSDLLVINIPNNDGKKSNIDFQIADVDAYELHVDSKGNRSTSDVYQGMFGYVTFENKFKCILTINSGYKLKGTKLEKVVLEDIDFNNEFDVKSNDQLEARYILTPDMMEKILKLEKIIKNVKIVFANKTLYIGAEKVNMFELKKYKKGDPLTVFENLYDEIELVLSIVEELKNNDKVFKM